MPPPKWSKVAAKPSGGCVAFAASQPLSDTAALICFGHRKGLSDEVWTFDPTCDDPWTLMHEPHQAVKPPLRTQSALAKLNNTDEKAAYFLLFGGFVQDVGEVNDTWKLRVPLDSTMNATPIQWQKLDCGDAQPDARYGHSLTNVKHYIVLFGGQNGNHQFNDLWAFDDAKSQWMEISVQTGVPPTPRTLHCAVEWSGKLLIIGGFSRSSGYLGDVHALSISDEDNPKGDFQPVEIKLQEKGASWTARAQHCAATTGKSTNVFIFGGFDGTNVLNDLWMLNGSEFGAVNFTEIRLAGAPESRARSSCHILGSALCILGGFDGNKPVGTEVYHLNVEAPHTLVASSNDDAKGDAHVEENDADQSAESEEIRDG